MAKCCMCGSKYNPEEARDIFEDEYGLHDYGNFIRPLCGDCAKSVFSDLIDGYYKETCECCGKEYDPFIENSKFGMHVDGIDLEDVSLTICCDCALDRLDEQAHS